MVADSRPAAGRGGTYFPPARWAVSLMFLANGFMVGNWVPKIPEFKARLELSESGLGLMILLFGIGSIAAMPAIAALVARKGSRAVTRWTAVPMAFVILAITVASGIPAAGITMLVAGALIGGMDIAMNANAVAVEKHMRRSIMSSCHGFWSLGALAGSSAGGYVIDTLGVFGHAWYVTLFCVILVLAALSRLHEGEDDENGKGVGLKLPASPLPYLLGIIALISTVPEGAVIDWSALYLRQELGADISISGFGYGALALSMAIVRFISDPLRDRFGAVPIVRASTLFAGAGFLLAGYTDSPVLAITGFAIAGIGVANIFPVAMSAAGNLPGFAQGVAISVVAFMAYSGILLAPSAIGFVAERTGFSPVFMVMAVMFALAAMMSSITRHADNA